MNDVTAKTLHIKKEKENLFAADVIKIRKVKHKTILFKHWFSSDIIFNA